MHIKDIRRKNLRMLAKQVGGVSRLAIKLHRSQSQISHLIGANPIKNIGDIFASKIEEVFEKPVGWLDTLQDFSLANTEACPPFFSTFPAVPLIEWAQIYPWLESRSNQAPMRNYSLIPVKSNFTDQAFALRMRSDEMESSVNVAIPRNALIIVEPADKIKNGSLLIVSTDRHIEPICRQLFIDGDEHYLKPLNTRYPIIKVAHYISYGVVRQVLVDFE